MGGRELDWMEPKDGGGQGTVVAAPRAEGPRALCELPLSGNESPPGLKQLSHLEGAGLRGSPRPRSLSPWVARAGALPLGNSGCRPEGGRTARTGQN